MAGRHHTCSGGRTHTAGVAGERPAAGTRAEVLLFEVKMYRNGSLTAKSPLDTQMGEHWPGLWASARKTQTVTGAVAQKDSEVDGCPCPNQGRRWPHLHPA